MLEYLEGALEVHHGLHDQQARITDSSLAGNEITEASADFAIEDEPEAPLTAEDGDKSVAAKPRRRPRRKREPEVETADCGACGAVIPADAKECPTCGAKFE